MRIRNVRSWGGVAVDVLIDGAKIAALSPHDPTLPVAPGELDGRGRILIPSLSDVHVHHLGGAVARIANDATAFSHRDAPFFINVIGRTADPGRFGAIRDWTRGLRSALAPHARADMQPNFLGEASDLEKYAHDSATHAKLVALRARYDPDGLLAPVRTG